MLDKKQLLCKNQCETGNEDGAVQSDSKVWEVEQWSIGTHIPLGSNCGYLRKKIFFLSIYEYFF